MQTPVEAFVKWFDTVPASIREVLAHVFQVATTEDTAVMAAARAQSLQRFRHWVVRPDFPLRIAARMFYIRSIFDMVIFHHPEILAGQDSPILPGDQEKIRSIAPKQWEVVIETWTRLRRQELADSFIHSWASWMIQLKTEKA